MPTESAFSFLRKIDAISQSAAAFVIHGPQAFLKEYVFDTLRSGLSGRGREYRGFQVGAGDNFDAVLNEIATPGLFAASSIIGCRVLRSRRERVAEGDEPARADSGPAGGEAGLAEAIERLRPPARLIVLYERDTAPAPVRRAAERSAVLIICAKPFDSQLGQYATSFARSLGLGLTPAATDYLVSRFGADLGAVANALGKASLNCASGGPVDLPDLQEQGSKRAPELFDLADSLGRGDPQSAVALFDRALAVGRDPFELLAVEIIPTLRRMLIAASMLAKRKSAAEIAQAFGVQPTSPLAARAIDGARRFGLERLGLAHKTASDLDAGFKMGLLRGREQAISRLIVELVAPQE